MKGKLGNVAEKRNQFEGKMREVEAVSVLRVIRLNTL